MSTREQFALAVLAGLGSVYPVTTDNVDALVAQQIAEGSSAVNNPMDTTEPWEGATDYNSVGVKNYLTFADGVGASVATLLNGDYASILDALERGNSAVNVASAPGWSTWGTGNFTPEVEQVAANRQTAYNETVAGGSPPAPVPVVPAPISESEGDSDMPNPLEWGAQFHTFSTMTGELIHRWYDPPADGKAGEWSVESLGTDVIPGSLRVGEYATTQLHVFADKSDGTTLHRWNDAGSATWGSEILPAVAG